MSASALLTSDPNSLPRPDPISAALSAHIDLVQALEQLRAPIETFATEVSTAIERSGRVFWMGNGGSAADSQHLAAELVGRFERERPGLPAIALTSDTAVLTSVANDYGFESVFARQVEAMCRPGDVLVGLSTSGNSANVVRAMERAERLQVYRVGMTGEGGGRLRHCCELWLEVPSTNTARIQEAQMLIGHILCDLVEQRAYKAANAR
ncbi:MAG: D-sedoheptulose 7-phosphate isomerase [Lamprobacter sp.]|uniref:D-sedoheptulose-7-phosphate isomerase n=1 Tax=Lamprobacter sp. TaxID=3100796 RepID=UPI002B262D22|nr:D-sedoheptulose 7-phosphate isomerase [Lamprobacter sp.]MEA3639358.1 D-sedoheptulose 7-phosphate isomerase [Lamprobacter sp.]